MTEFDWSTFLKRWSEEWLQDRRYRDQTPPEVVARGWLGYPGATEEEIAAAEQRLETTLPPSYRTFLSITNGWRNTSPFIDHLWSTHQIAWLTERNQDLIDVWTAPDMVEFDFWESRYLPTALEISDWGDSALYVLNPRVIRADGEWQATFFANWASPCAQVHGSFRELMLAEFETFRDLRRRGLA